MSLFMKIYLTFHSLLIVTKRSDDLLVYVSSTPVETTKQSAELDDVPIDAPNDVPISAPSEAYCESDAPSGSDSPSPSPAPELDLPIALWKGKRTCIYPVSTFISYDGLSTPSRAFIANLDSIVVLKTVGEALAYFGWRDAMIEEMNALDHNDTWASIDLPVHKKPIDCKWVFSVKINLDGSIARLKARLVAKVYAQTYGIDYSQNFSQNAFLHGDLEEEVYMEQPPRFVAQGEYGRVCCILLVVYVDDIVITSSDKVGIKKLKSFIGQIEAKLCDEPMIPKLKLKSEDGRLLHYPEKYRRVVGKLNYLTITRPNIAFLGTPGLGILYANHGHHITEGFTYADYVGCPNTSRSIIGYCVFIGGNLVSWKSEIGFPQSKPMKMWCDNQTTIYIATNMVFHERTKHIEVDCHFTHEKLEDGTITTPHIKTESHLADVLTKELP
ncbi:retrovirus-related pol polyprotein from transposon TNT 1-94 [Tanacetum coccineum]